jgi:hypothetical protein
MDHLIDCRNADALPHRREVAGPFGLAAATEDRIGANPSSYPDR